MGEAGFLKNEEPHGIRADVARLVLDRGRVSKAETVEQALAYRKALAHRPDWNHEIAVTVVEVCGSTGCNWFDLAKP